MTEFKSTDVPMDQPRSASPEILTQAAMTHENLIQRLEHELTLIPLPHDFEETLSCGGDKSRLVELPK